MTAIPQFFTNGNPLFSTYAFHTGILCTKMFAVTLLTSRQRYKHKAFANLEDAQSKKGTVAKNDDVERVRRAHLNDLENIPPFILISFLYILTQPKACTAKKLFTAFTAARIIHTFVYAVKPLRQPARALSFGVGLGVTSYMVFKVIKHFA